MKDVHAWALGAEIGDSVIYFREWLEGQDPLWEPYRSKSAHPALGPAMQAHLEGLVFLCQRRVRTGLHSGQLQYEAIRIGSRVQAMLSRCQVLGTEDEEDSLSYVRVAPRRPRFREVQA